MRFRNALFAFALFLYGPPLANANARHGYIPTASLGGLSVLNDNITPLYNNLMASFSGGNTSNLNNLTPGTNINNSGYPIGVLPFGLSGTVAISPSYYGHYTIQWTGVGALNTSFGSGLNAIVYNGGAAAIGITPANTGTYVGFEAYNNSSLTTGANVEFAYGVLMTGVSSVSGANCNGGGTCVQFTTASNGAFNWPTGTTVICNNLTGLGTGPNADGSWTVDSINSTTFTLNNSAGVAGSVAITGTGGPGVQSECITNIPTGLLSVNFPTSISGGLINSSPGYTFSGLSFVQTTNLASFNAGHQVQDNVISFLHAYKPKYFRAMDIMGGQSFYANYADILPSTALSFSSGRWPTAYWAGSSAGSSDNFTLTNGSSGAYVDGETVQFSANRSTVGSNPTLQINSRGQVPIYSSSYVPLYLPITGSATTGDVVSVIFSGQFSHTVTYTVQAGDTLASISANLGTNLNNDSIVAANGISCGLVSNLLFCYTIPFNGVLTVSSTTSGSATETCTPGTFQNASAFASGSKYTLIYNAVLGGFVQIINSSNGLIVPPPISVLSEIATRANVGLWLTTPMPFTLSAWQSLGQWAANNLNSLPVAIEPMNEVWNGSANPTPQVTAVSRALGFTYTGSGNGPRPYQDYYGLTVAQMSSAFAASYVAAGGSRGNLQVLNMDVVGDGDGSFSDNTMICCRWNGADLTGTPGSFLGTITSNTTLTVSGITGFIWPGLTLNGSCVTAGTKIGLQQSGTNLGNGVYTITPSNTNGSCSMTVTNPVYTAIGGPDATAGTAYNAFPTRPIDVTDGIGFATYWSGALAGQGAATWNGTQANYNALFQASANYAAGGSTNITNALNAWDADLNSGTVGTTGGTNTICFFLQGAYTSTCPTANTGGELRAYETDVKLYDGARPSGKANLSVYLYEGSIQQTLAGNSINGTSSATSPTDLNSQFTANSWTLSPTYGASNLAVATNIVNLQIAYFSSTQFYNTQLNFWNSMKTIFSDRPNFAPAQFGVTGPQTSGAVPQIPLWGIFPGDLTTTILSNGSAQESYN